MNAFVRRLAALSALWALCELLLPDGRQRKLARFAASALTMAALVSALGGLLGGDARLAWDAPAISAGVPDASAYQAAALRSVANQASALCERVASRAGYDATATAYLRRDGSLSHVALALRAREPATLLAPDELAALLAQTLGCDETAIHWTDGAMDE